MDAKETTKSFNMSISDPQQKKFFYDSRVEVTQKGVLQTGASEESTTVKVDP